MGGLSDDSNNQQSNQVFDNEQPIETYIQEPLRKASFGSFNSDEQQSNTTPSDHNKNHTNTEPPSDSVFMMKKASLGGFTIQEESESFSEFDKDDEISLRRSQLDMDDDANSNEENSFNNEMKIKEKVNDMLANKQEDKLNEEVKSKASPI